MKVMLTAFGITDRRPDIIASSSLFHLMPPVNMRAMADKFLPDYTTLLLCEKLVMDEASFGMLSERPHFLYGYVAETLNALHSEGFIELVNFRDIIVTREALLQKMLEHDLIQTDLWIDTLRESIEIWDDFSQRAESFMGSIYRKAIEETESLALPTKPEFSQDDLLIELAKHKQGLNADQLSKVSGLTPTEAKQALEDLAKLAFIKTQGHGHQRGIALHDEMHHIFQEYIFQEHVPPHTELLVSDTSRLVREALKSSRKRRQSEYRRALQSVLRWYLSYVNANIVLSNDLGAGFHDWADVLPFYNQKFLSVGKEGHGVSQQASQSQKLFEVSFPEYAVTDTSTLMRILTDKRIVDLRRLVQEAVDGKVVFDNEFAKSTLREVWQMETRVAKYRNIVSYLTLPLDFLPWVGTVVQKGVEEGVGLVLEKKLKEKYRWFYMLSDIVDSNKALQPKHKHRRRRR